MAVIKLIKVADVLEILPFGKSTLFARLSANSGVYDPTFPKPVKLGGRGSFWIEAEINCWLEKQIAARGTAVPVRLRLEAPQVSTKGI